MTVIDRYLLSLSSEATKKDEKINRIGLPVPLVRKSLKQKKFFSELSEREALKEWGNVWNKSLYFESMSMSLYYYQGKSLSKEEFLKIQKWVDRCTCWEHSDDLSKIFAKVVEENPDWTMQIFRKWNKSACFWKRRQSIVSLIEYASKRKKVLPFKTLVSFITPLLSDDEYYVQKALGWTLRETYNIYPTKTKQYFSTYLNNISSTAYSAATEKLDDKFKKSLNEKRKVHRSKKNT